MGVVIEVGGGGVAEELGEERTSGEGGERIKRVSLLSEETR